MSAAEIKAAMTVCKIYFEIAEEILGTEEVRRRFTIRLDEEIRKLERQRAEQRKP